MHTAFTVEWGLINPADRRLAPRFNSRHEEIYMKRLIVLMLLAMFSVGTLTACNTVKGAGQDVQKVGEKVEDAAKDTGATNP